MHQCVCISYEDHGKAYELVVSVIPDTIESSIYGGGDKEDHEADIRNLHMRLPLGEGPKSRTMSFVESKWLRVSVGRELEDDLEEERGSPSSSRLSVLSSLSICSSTQSSSDSSPAEPLLLRRMLTSRLRRKT